jgi:hypothetical protein
MITQNHQNDPETAPFTRPQATLVLAAVTSSGQQVDSQPDISDLMVAPNNQFEESAENSCRILSDPTGTIQHTVCDTKANWALFDEKYGIQANREITESPNSVVEVDYEVCRKEKPSGTHISRKICKTPEQWAEFDAERQNDSAEAFRQMVESSIRGADGPGPTPSDVDAMNNIVR